VHDYFHVASCGIEARFDAAVDCHQSVAELSRQTAKLRTDVFRRTSHVTYVNFLFAAREASQGTPSILLKRIDAP
jgi:hypothetical protein